ncbi:MAG: TIGR01841 family phasin [Pseudomonadota bacterium]
MNAQSFPFVFDAEKMKDLFKMPELDKMFDQSKMPNFDMDAMVSAHQKNVGALVDANKAVMAGYQELYKRQVSLVEESLAKAKDQILDMQSQPISADQATKSAEQMKTAIEKAAADVRELAEMAQQANTEAFNIIKGRFDEAVTEFKTAADKMMG